MASNPTSLTVAWLVPASMRKALDFKCSSQTGDEDGAPCRSECLPANLRLDMNDGIDATAAVAECRGVSDLTGS
jgi:hypothetical protein